MQPTKRQFDFEMERKGREERTDERREERGERRRGLEEIGPCSLACIKEYVSCEIHITNQMNL